MKSNSSKNHEIFDKFCVNHTLLCLALEKSVKYCKLVYLYVDIYEIQKN